MKLRDLIPNPLLEAGLSRVWSQVQTFDIATITAFRGINENCIVSATDVEAGGEYTKQMNLARNKTLKAKLMSAGYGVTAIDGAYIENFGDPEAMREVKENSFFVVNLKKDPNFKTTILKLGKMFCQDSVLLKEDDGFYLHGTNKADWPGLGQRSKIGNRFVGGIEREFMSKIRNRPFSFEESKTPPIEDLVENIHSTRFYNINTIRLIKEEAKKDCCK